jgi:hypothetical protein
MKSPGEMQDGDVIEILVQPHRDQRAAVRFFRRLLRGQRVPNHCGSLQTNLATFSANMSACSATEDQNALPALDDAGKRFDIQLTFHFATPEDEHAKSQTRLHRFI